MADDDDLPPPPPGGFLSDPGPAGPERAVQVALERAVQALEAMRDEMRAIRQLLERQQRGSGTRPPVADADDGPL